MIVFVLYDSINNSVFQSQVLAPLVNILESDEHAEIMIVSFEREQITPERLIQLIPAHKNLHLKIIKRVPFVGKLSLRLGKWQFLNFIKTVPSCTQIIARGPLAGWVTLNTLKTMVWARHAHIPALTIQARGLGAEEYRYTHMRRKKALWEHFYQRWIYQSLQVIEHDVYRTRNKKDRFHAVTIESVSPALSDYLKKHFNSDPGKIILASRDIPKKISQELVVNWKQKMRTELGIPQDAIVYCYSGSYKPWQCADTSVQHFVHEYQKEKKSYLLLLSHDVQAFKKVLENHNVLLGCFKIIGAPAHDILRYLAVANFGYLFREPDIINWVSRPTKMLEYQAVGLEIIHNNTVAWLVE